MAFLSLFRHIVLGVACIFTAAPLFSTSTALATPEASPSETVEANEPDLLVLERCLELLEEHYLRLEKLEPQALFRQSLTYLASVTSDGLFVPGEEGEPDALLIGYRTILLDSEAIKTNEDLVTALGDVASFYRQATVFHDLEYDDDIERILTVGMLKTLDHPTRVLVDRGLESFQVRSRGSLIGVGMVVNLRDGHPWIKEVVVRGPAERGGVRVGDTILRVDGESTQDMPLSEVVSRLRGEVGTEVVLDLRRPGQDQPVVMTLKRAKVRVENVKVTRLPGDIIYLSISNFSDRTLTNFRAQLRTLFLEDKNYKGFILDLRANRGGSLKQSAFVADQFVNEGLLVRTTGRNDKKVRGLVEVINSTPEMFIPDDVPVAVLVSPRTASGAEILAGCLKYLDRAIIIGRGTYGKGTVQKTYKINEETILKATVARYLVEGDQWLHGVGMQPDVEVTEIAVRDGKIRIGDEREIRKFVATPVGELDEFQGQGEARAQFRVQHVTVETPAGTDEKEKEASQAPSTLAERLAEDYDVSLASQLLLEVGKPTRTATLRRISRVVEEANATQMALLTQSLQALQVDWSTMPPTQGLVEGDFASQGEEAPLSISLADGDKIQALTPDEEDVQLTLTANLAGEDSWHRVRVSTLSADKRFSGLDFMLGKVDPGAPLQATIPIRLPRYVESGVREVRLIVTADNLAKPLELIQYVDVKAAKKPEFSVHVAYHDSPEFGGLGDGDGIPEAGERIAVAVSVKNEGQRDSGEVKITLKNPLRKDIEVQKGSHLIEEVAMHGVGQAVLTFDVKEVPNAEEFPPVEVSLVIRDRINGYSLTRALTFEEHLTAADGQGPIQLTHAPAGWHDDGIHLLPPRIVLKEAVVNDPIEDETLFVKAIAIDDVGLKVFTLYVDGTKVGRMLGKEGLDGRTLKLEQSVHLKPGPHVIELVALDNTGLKSRYRFRTAVKADSAATAEVLSPER